MPRRRYASGDYDRDHRGAKHERDRIRLPAYVDMTHNAYHTGSPCTATSELVSILTQRLVFDVEPVRSLVLRHAGGIKRTQACDQCITDQRDKTGM